MLPQAFYWIGVEAGTNYQWVLADGSGSIGNGQPSNAAPHAHWCAPLRRACMQLQLSQGQMPRA
jgi:hypothetical protein